MAFECRHLFLATRDRQEHLLVAVMVHIVSAFIAVVLVRIMVALLSGTECKIPSGVPAHVFTDAEPLISRRFYGRGSINTRHLIRTTNQEDLRVLKTSGRLHILGLTPYELWP